MATVSLVISVAVLGFAAWNWWSLRHVRRWLRDVQRDLRENGVYR